MNIKTWIIVCLAFLSGSGIGAILGCRSERNKLQKINNVLFGAMKPEEKALSKRDPLNQVKFLLFSRGNAVEYEDLPKGRNYRVAVPVNKLYSEAVVQMDTMLGDIPYFVRNLPNVEKGYAFRK